jgi:hypothetical protein
MDKTSQFNELRRRARQVIDLIKRVNPKAGNILQQLLTAADSNNAIQLLSLIAQLDDVPATDDSKFLLDFLPTIDMPILTRGVPGSVGDAVLTRLATGGADNDDEGEEMSTLQRFRHNLAMFKREDGLKFIAVITAISVANGLMYTAITGDELSGYVAAATTATMLAFFLLYLVCTVDKKEQGDDPDAPFDEGMSLSGGTAKHSELNSSMGNVVLCAVLVIVVILLLYLLSCVWPAPCRLVAYSRA